jgi:hypothetical protein
MPLLAKGQANAKAQRRKGTQRRTFEIISVVWIGGRLGIRVLPSFAALCAFAPLR